MSTNIKSAQQTAAQLADNVAQSADNAIHSTQRATNQALDQLSNKVQDLNEQATPVLNRLSAQAEAISHRVVEAVRDGSKRVRQQANNAADSTVTYIREEPVKSVLIAAAAGAALLAITKLVLDRRHRD